MKLVQAKIALAVKADQATRRTETGDHETGVTPLRLRAANPN
jgi:hypothetical protein